ncbi:MAG: NUDIX hydrolase [Proteobacteria bacterium]|nr:NUDIX hydrolase [Pseudomonadota bacterium]MBI3497966.1 NUDIX hydrolase [Pseudomonadota bacterium]
MDVRYPVSIKAVILEGDRVVLLENERLEWELPGGRLEPGERPEECLAREIAEELGLAADGQEILTSELFEVIPGRHVFIVSYRAWVAGGIEGLRVSPEHRRAQVFALSELASIKLPQVYRRAIARAVDIKERIARK